MLSAALLMCTAAHAQVFAQQVNKLTANDFPSKQGFAVAVSDDGTTALVGSPADDGNTGAAWGFARDMEGNWTQLGSKLVGTGAIGQGEQGWSVALSGDGNTALVGSPYDNNNSGAAWIFTRDNKGNWTQQGGKLVGSGAVTGTYGSQQGRSVALSDNGNTALIGGPTDNNNVGAVWVFTRDKNGNWSQQGSKLVASDASGKPQQGYSVALSTDASTVVVGGPLDDSYAGAMWVYTNSNGNWTQQGSKLVGSGAVNGTHGAEQGWSVAVSWNGDTAVSGGPYDNGNAGAVWVFTRDNNNGNWSQQGNKLVGSGAVNGSSGARQGSAVALSWDANTLLSGAPSDNSAAGALWVFTQAIDGTWSQQGGKFLGAGGVGASWQGYSLALSADGLTLLEGGPFDNANTGAVWAFVRAVSESLQFVPVPPCRVVDTRNWGVGFGEFSAGETRTYQIRGCWIPANAAAYSLNVAVVPDAALGYLTIWPTGQSRPYVSNINSDGRVKANAAIVPAGSDGSINVYASNRTHLILDVNGYFVNGARLGFYPLPPCRVADTRTANGPLGGPYLSGGAVRSFPILSSSCSIPSTAAAYSLNFTAVPHGPLGYMTVWPTGYTQPRVSTLNAPTGAVTANAALVSAGSWGEISVYPTNDTDLVIDVNGYFAPLGRGVLSLYTQTPCRVLDTRNSSGQFQGTLAVNVTGASCGSLASSAQAFLFQATVVPPGPLGYLTLWPDGETQPYVATLNALDAAITSNLAIVPTVNGSIDAFASNPTQLVLDTFGFFAP